ncbi:MAG: 23S rRNA (guanosine(2251)-2'-O)-methyltransferase RlmB [Flavobacteriales bacterium]|nr:23S rRNA (guanosine(2251)-2'-O)-methyltransferase RlmB [Flavobacteriales bacterium]
MNDPAKNIVFGIRAILEALNAGKNFDKIFLKQGSSGELISSLLSLAKEREISLKLVPQAKLDSITRKNHQGAIGFIAAIDYQNFEEIITGLFEKGKDPLILALDELTDVRNFGAIARTALCMGVDAIVIPAGGSVSVTPDAIKTSAGALMTLPVCKVKSLPVALEKMKEYGLSIIGCTEKGKDSITDLSYKGPLTLVMGSEEKGLSNVVLRIADNLAFIPITGPVRSLNVSVATAMFLYEVDRQRRIW